MTLEALEASAITKKIGLTETVAQNGKQVTG